MLRLSHLIVFSLAAILSLGVAAWVRRQAGGRAANALVILLGLDAAWTLTVVAQILATSFDWMLLWGIASMVFYIAVPIVWFVFAVHYTGRDYWLTPPAWTVLAASYLVPTAITLTVAVHGHGWGEVWLVTDPLSTIGLDPNRSFLVLLFVLYAYTAAGIALIVDLMLSTPRVDRVQIGAVVVGAVAVVAMGVLSWTDLLPVPGLDYSPIGVAIFGTSVAWGLYRDRLFPVLPVARETILDAIDDAVVVVDESGTIADYNAAASTLLPGLDDGVGSALADVCPALVDDTPSDYSSIDGTEERFAEAVTISTPEEIRSCRVTVSELRRRDALFGYALIVRDVTDVEAYVTELEHKTTQIERFASTISHDLRNPLMAAQGYVDLARETDDFEKLERTDTAHDRIEETIDDLLRLARTGETIRERRPISLADVAREAWQTSTARNGRLVCELDPDLRIEADAARLQGLFENLFRNCVEHSSTNDRPAAGPTDDRDESVVTVRVGRHEDGFFVEDDGPGVPETERDRIFEHGYTTQTGGSGLGLAMVESVATAHGWDVSVESAPSGGVRFLFSEVRLSAS